MEAHNVESLLSAYKAAVAEVSNIDKSGVYPIYPEAICEFMRILQVEPWVATDYQPSRIRELMKSVETATVTDVRWMLTAAARSERFGDGNWAGLLESKALEPVMQRLKFLCNSK